MCDKESVIFIDGMTCHSCVNHIESMLMPQPGVKQVKVSLELKFAFVRYDPSVTSLPSLAAVVNDIGFEASLDDNEALSATWINVTGMTCHSCVQHIEGMVHSAVGVRSTRVSLSDSLATVIYDRRLTSASVICNVINDIGFDAELLPGLSTELSEACTGLQESADEFTQLAAMRRCVSQQTCEISVLGMTCNSCVKHIESTLSSVGAVISVNVSLEQNKAVVMFNPSEISAESIVEKIDEMGFEAAVLVNQCETHDDPSHMMAIIKNGRLGCVQQSDEQHAAQMTTQFSGM